MQRVWSRCAVRVSAAIIVLAGIPCLNAAAQEHSIAAALQSMGSRAGVVFAGQVESVRRTGDVVDVAFRVDQSLKGDVQGTFVLREWAGLWAGGARRFWVGERTVIFAHTPGAGGISSPVDGLDGVLPLRSAASEDPTLQARTERIATRVVRNSGDPLPPADAIALVDLPRIAQLTSGDADERLPNRHLPVVHGPGKMLPIHVTPTGDTEPTIEPRLRGIRSQERRDVPR